VCVADGANCLVSGSTSPLGQCRSGQCACAHLDEPCCINGRPTTIGGCASFDLYCDAVGTGSSGLCKPCGHSGEQCCQGDTCIEQGTGCIQSGDLSPNLCKPCGATGQPCCPPSGTSGPTCRGTTCNTSTGLC
jgi:hypothetical protein